MKHSRTSHKFHALQSAQSKDSWLHAISQIFLQRVNLKTPNQKYTQLARHSRQSKARDQRDASTTRDTQGNSTTRPTTDTARQLGHRTSLSRLTLRLQQVTPETANATYTSKHLSRNFVCYATRDIQLAVSRFILITNTIDILDGRVKKNYESIHVPLKVASAAECMEPRFSKAITRAMKSLGSAPEWGRISSRIMRNSCP